MFEIRIYLSSLAHPSTDSASQSINGEWSHLVSSSDEQRGENQFPNILIKDLGLAHNELLPLFVLCHLSINSQSEKKQYQTTS